MRDLSNETLQLNYPCTWPYKLVVLEKTNIKIVVKEVLSQREHTIKKSKKSSKGKFVSYTLELIVHNEDDRKTLYEILSAHDKIKMVL